MTQSSDLETLFPTRDAIPADFWHVPDEAGLTLLVDGQTRRWDGPSEPIRSAVCVPEADGRLAPCLLEALGSCSVFLGPPPA